ncbi:MAG: glycoside hydrolase family 78 protein [Oscillospiraceae bacterium]|jgi:alpha-L-rhamnosidase|nr:glycoside hydrolase family 78 protein [Oscillospiraceae bacterium]
MAAIFGAEWLQYPEDIGEAAAVFRLCFVPEKPVAAARLQATALGVYNAYINGARVGEQVLAPGWTNYRKRLQYQSYDVAALLRAGAENVLMLEAAAGWRMHAREKDWRHCAIGGKETAVIAALELRFADGTARLFHTGAAWSCCLSAVRRANLYDGESYDAGFVDGYWRSPKVLAYEKEILIPEEGERIVEVERLPARELLTTPAGETVLDFGQNLTGYVEFRIDGAAGKTAVLRHAEILDAAGNFYTANLRSAKQEVRFLCDGRAHTYKPCFTFQGFRYVRLQDWPCEIRKEDFTAIVVHSEMRRTGFFDCSSPLLNRFFENIVWGQKGNFLDVPTDCPQRDERLGWTGDVQIFCRTASYLFDCERFFKKWLADLASEQFANGGIPHVIPRLHWDGDSSAGWADAAVICPWQIYLTYGDADILLRQFSSMRAWVDYMIARSENALWMSDGHFGDWLCLDETPTSGALLRNAYFAYSTGLLIKAGKVLGADMRKYERQLAATKAAYIREFLPEGEVLCNTQTGCVLTLYFDLTGAYQVQVAAQLAALVRETGHLKTGFLGTPYLLHALSENGYGALAYDLLLRREYPSWLYPVTMGATTVWERWDGQRPDGSFQEAGMNSFNHYAYGAVGDWLLGVAAGIQTVEDAPGFSAVRFAPLPDARLGHLRGAVETRRGRVESGWRYAQDGSVVYTFTVPEGCEATADIGGRVLCLKPGTTTLSAEA